MKVVIDKTRVVRLTASRDGTQGHYIGRLIDSVDVSEAVKLAKACNRILPHGSHGADYERQRIARQHMASVLQ
jgi:hypothetical protein